MIAICGWMLIHVAIINGLFNFILFDFYRYYFKVFKTKRLTTIKINICNFTKTDSLYEKVLSILPLIILFLRV